MITREQLEEGLEKENQYGKLKEDSTIVALLLLRERIPYDVCSRIIGGAEHDVIYLCDVEYALRYLNEEDIIKLADCNIYIDSDVDSLSSFI